MEPLASEAANTDKFCWICLSDDAASDLCVPCACPGKYVHKACMARWQLQRTGTSEETKCRFCNQELPDWRQVWQVKNEGPRKAKMGIDVNGSYIVIEASVGPDGRTNFEDAVRERLGLDSCTSLDFSFKCKAPDGKGFVTLDGANSYGAAVHCALVTRQARHSRSAPANTLDHAAGAAST